MLTSFESFLEQSQKDLARVTKNFLLEKCVIQLNNDIQLSGLSFNLVNDVDFPVLSQVVSMLEKLSSQEFSSFIYVLDIPEEWGIQLCFQKGEISKVANVICYRALSKVYFRIKYK